MTNIEGTKSRQLTKDDIALMVRELVLVTLPHKDPGDIPEWVRRNGNITLDVHFVSPAPVGAGLVPA